MPLRIVGLAFHRTPTGSLWCLGEVGEAGLLEGRTDLLGDEGPVTLYRGRAVEDRTVGHLTREVLQGGAVEV